MRYLVALLVTILGCNAAPYVSFHPAVYSAVPAVAAVWSPVPAVTQYHAQDELGQYSYGYSGGPSAKNEVKTLDGITRGSYSYIDANSKLQTVQYVADALGFRVAATNLPSPAVDLNVAPIDHAQPVEDTVEVKQAKQEHLAAVARAQTEDSEAEVVEAPQPVEDTPEVQQAKEDHRQAVEDAKQAVEDANARVSEKVQQAEEAHARAVEEHVQADKEHAQAVVEHIQDANARLSEEHESHLLEGHIPVIVAQHHLVNAPLAIQPAAVHLAHSPILLRAPASFAYSVLAPGHSHQVIVA